MANEAERRGGTTAALLEAAAAELIDVGQADFSMESVGRRAFFSVGAVYSRWPDRGACIADVAGSVALDRLAAHIATCKGVDDVARLIVANPDRIFTLIGECILAAQTMPEVVVPARRLLTELRESLRTWMGPGMAWYCSTVAIGGALLDLMDVARPNIRAAPLFVDACEAERHRTSAGGETGIVLGPIDIPNVPLPSRSDPVATSLIDAARVVLAERGASAAGARDIASAAGVTTGALYRRYEGKSRLLADVLVTELEPDRYSWTWDLISAFAKDDPYTEAADVLAERIVESSRDRSGQQVLLQIGVAARNDPTLRAQVNQRISVAVDARRDMVEHFMKVGLLRGDMDPFVVAWGFQALPIGMRAVLPMIDSLDTDEVRDSMRAVLVALSPR